MPIPKPRKGEEKSKFISRCMGNEVMRSDFPSQAQRAAVCHSQWRKRNNMLMRNYKMKQNIATRVERLDDGVQYLVAPVVALVEGVHYGSGGPAFYPASEIQKFVEAWNNVPLTVGHPSVGGQHVRVGDSVIEDFEVGRFLNVEYEGGKLKGEVWIDPDKAQKISPEILEIIRENGELEVSTGLFAEGDGQEGFWKDERFEETLFNFKPDHLALLPGGEGACNWEDGCGVRSNRKKEGGKMEWNEQVKNNMKKDGYVVLELGHSKVRDQLQRILNDMDTATEMFFIREVFNKHFIFEVAKQGENSQLFKQSFSIDKKDKVKLSGDPVEVREMVDFVENFNSEKFSKEGISMLNEAKLVDEVIACEKLGFTEKDKDMLLNMNKADFLLFVNSAKKLSECDCDGEKKVVENSKKEEKKEEKKENMDKSKDEEVKKQEAAESKVPSFDDVLASASPEQRELFNRGIRKAKEEKDSLVSILFSNEKNKFSKEALEKMSIDVLENMVSYIATPEEKDNLVKNYSGNNPSLDEALDDPYARRVDGSGIPKVQDPSLILQENYNKNRK